jgi:thiamine kinase-like enzyme
MLALEDVATYLLDRELISTADVVNGAFRVSELNRRHCLFRVERDGLPNYLLKHASLAERSAALRHEAEVYTQLWDADGIAKDGVRLPRCFGYDPDRAVLILELFSDAATLREHCWKGGRFSQRLAARLGEVLGQLHNVRPQEGAAQSRLSAPHWALSAHRPDLDFFYEFSQATVQLVRVLQQSTELCRLLDRAREGWRCEATIHNDVRLDNCLVVGQSPQQDVVLLDWELAGPGDPCWDVGSLLAEFLSLWLLSIPFAAASSAEEWAALSLQPIDRMQPAIRAFWSSYLDRRELAPASRRDALERSVQYAAARLVQVAIEQAQMSPQPSAVAVICLQLALNILRQPDRAAAQLLGLRHQARS